MYNQTTLIESLSDMAATTQILIDYLLSSEEDNAHEAVTILLMQGITQLEPESEAMQQFFPVFYEIKQRIDLSDLQGALGQSRVFQTQLNEIISIVREG